MDFWKQLIDVLGGNLKSQAVQPRLMNLPDLIRYNSAVRGLYLDALAKLPWAEVVLPRGLSFDSARNVFVHLTVVEDRWVSYILPNRFSEWKDPEFEAYQDIESLRTYADQVKANTESFLKSMKATDWNRKITVPWIPAPNSITVETALSHMVMEDMIHFGELSAMFWQMNLQAPYLAFIRYKYKQENP